jgi:hypothetical protein
MFGPIHKSALASGVNANPPREIKALLLDRASCVVSEISMRMSLWRAKIHPAAALRLKDKHDLHRALQKSTILMRSSSISIFSTPGAAGRIPAPSRLRTRRRRLLPLRRCHPARDCRGAQRPRPGVSLRRKVI